MQTQFMPYAIRGTSGCTTHDVSPKPHEGFVNSQLAHLGSTPDLKLRSLIIDALFPGSDSKCCGVTCAVRSTGNDADFMLRCSVCDRLLALTENKPRYTPIQWSDAAITDFQSSAVVAPPLWVETAPLWIESKHNETVACVDLHPRKGTPCRLVAPQVLIYTNRHKAMPVSVITDRDISISELYRTIRNDSPEQGFELEETRFPIIRSSTIVNKLAEAAPEFSPDVIETLHGIVHAFWIWAPRLVDPKLSTQARSWIPDNLRECADKNGCSNQPWEQFAAARLEARKRRDLKSGQ
ncbi:hypothetical protein BDB13_3025 [Rhodococcus sp. OK302]|nr:hypothetical protein BDB13_3025 [Rhodococcus sp. OK302]